MSKFVMAYQRLAETGLGRDEVAELLAETESFIRTAESWLARPKD